MSSDFCTKEEKKAIAAGSGGRALRQPVRQGHPAASAPRRRPAPRRPPAQVPPPGREARAERAAQGHLRHRHAGRRRQRPDPHRALHQAVQVRRREDGDPDVRDFQQIAGRAGRKGFDDQGRVVAQAPEHVIENLRNEQKAAGDPEEAQKARQAQAAREGLRALGQGDLRAALQRPPEPLVSRFEVTHGMLLNVLEPPEADGCRAMAR